MNVVQNTAERTLLVFRPRAWPPFALFLMLTGTAGWAWRTTGLALWLIVGAILLLLSVAMFLALCFNRRTVTFDWPGQRVDTRGHNWNPLFKDEVQHESLASLTRWTVTQEDNQLGRATQVWTIGFERNTGKPVDELLFERTLVEARRKALLLAQHNQRPVQLVSTLDTFPASRHSLPPDALADLVGSSRRTQDSERKARPQVIIDGEAAGHLKISLPTDRRKIPSRGGLTTRWPLMLFEGLLCLMIAMGLPSSQSRPHPAFELALAYSLVVFPIFCIGGTCMWVGLRDLTGRTRIEVFGGVLRLTQTALGGVPYRRIEGSAEKCGATLVAKLGYNPCLIVLFADRECRVGVGLPAGELVKAREVLTRAVGSQG